MPALDSIRFEPINLSHQALLQDRFRRLNISIAEYSFANIYLFRKKHRFELVKIENEIFIKGMTRDGFSYLMPTVDPATLSPVFLKSLRELAQIFFPIPDSWIPFFESLCGEPIFKDEESDYLFQTSKLAAFPGRHLSNKRNLVKQLFQHHEIQSETLTDQFDDALTILEKWQQEEADSNDTDYTACKEALQLFHPLKLMGRLIYIDQLPAAFHIGEKIGNDCYAVHFTKASREVKGLYQFLYQDLAQFVEGNCSWINLEQDLGIPSLHQAKQSYLPDQMLHKWRIKLT